VALMVYLIIRFLGHETHAVPVLVEAPAWWGLGVMPFIGLLLAIAILPLVPATQHWWHLNIHRLQVSLACGALTVGYLFWISGSTAAINALEHAIIFEYIPFIILLFSLYVISGGVCLSGDLPAHPLTNTAFLAAGAVSASFIGTTGASMLLIRALLQTNSERRRVVHTVVFFIFLVSNVGGTLLPIGDPPLFLGYLAGVPFEWTLSLWKEWALCTALLLVVYYIWDQVEYHRETRSAITRDERVREPLRLRGSVNLLWLLGVVLAVAFIVPGKPIPALGMTAFPFLRELVLLAFVAISLLATPRALRRANGFNYHAILEVAALFIGVFITMQVPIIVLKAEGDQLAAYLSQPWQFYWITGLLSAVLDNAPSYAVFFELAKTMPPDDTAPLALEGGRGVISVGRLTAISLGSVFMGAMTYIGNGPNFMVKSIAEQAGVAMPSFFGYVIRFSIPVLIPIFVLVTIVFLR